MLYARTAAPQMICVNPFGSFIAITAQQMKNQCITSARLVHPHGVVTKRRNPHKIHHTSITGEKTQNSNESFNSTVWKYCPKTSGSSKRIVDVAVNEAVVMYNDGMAGRLDIMKHLGCKLGHFSVTYAFQSDNARIKEAEMKSRSSTLDARRALRMRKKVMHEHFVEIEGVTYEAGAF
ncbi:uncharacterized protein TNCV_4543321 [Trichonephila clavipes]|nr:uncharacterized protein TNCV_4543321 [Trichonephila clavipes]